jgi:hypothetical protein
MSAQTVVMTSFLIYIQMEPIRQPDGWILRNKEQGRCPDIFEA